VLGGPARRAASIGRVASKLSILVGFAPGAPALLCMPEIVTQWSPAIEEALSLHATTPPRAVHERELLLARLLLAHGPAGAQQILQLARDFLDGLATAEELRSAQQDCWAYVGSVACACSVADSAAGAAFLACLESDGAAHTPAALAEQARRALQAGVAELEVLAVLAQRVGSY
jgi:hypothetical protein